MNRRPYFGLTWGGLASWMALATVGAVVCYWLDTPLEYLTYTWVTALLARQMEDS